MQDRSKFQFLPRVTSTPSARSAGPSARPATDLDASFTSARTQRKRAQKPTYRPGGSEKDFTYRHRKENPQAANEAIPAPFQQRSRRSLGELNPNNVATPTNNNALVPVRKKKRKNRVLADIRLLQRTTHLLIRRASFSRVVREIATRMHFNRALEFRWQATALDCLQEAAEAFLVGFFEQAAMAATHAHRVTVKVQDIHLVCRFNNILS